MNQTIIQVAPDQLFFDLQNPRIAEFNLGIYSEEEIIGILWNVMGVEEIVLSIKASGFFEHEPLICVRESDKLIVIEGNRRLAAIKCIVNPSIADYITGINKNVLLGVSQDTLTELQAIPVIVVGDRKDAWRFIGFKHINGPAKWGSYAKAQYISLIKNEYEVSLGTIASQIGDTHKTVQKLYQGLQVIEQAERSGKFDRADIKAPRLYFSHLYTGLSYDGIKEFIGIKDISEEASNPVPADKLDNLGELLLWFFGSERQEVEPVIQSQNPDLRRIEAVIKNKESLFALRDGVPLAVAYDISQPKDETFEQSLLEAKRALQKAQSYQTEGFDGKDESLLIQAASVAKIAEELYQAMEQKWQSQQSDTPKKRLFDRD
jgi:hypothetical protein